MRREDVKKFKDKKGKKFQGEDMVVITALPEPSEGIDGIETHDVQDMVVDDYLGEKLGYRGYRTSAEKLQKFIDRNNERIVDLQEENEGYQEMIDALAEVPIPDPPE